ncbi:galactoside 2-alpha-L-fucosyltransferase-like [Malania oleifera]|uniref:galactoside 2-alpha-L-fucosyltransferase-like n=1 Tax=Malania oleifera TaxID=397392 RepID=UPI0025AE3C93|nr:galactoside 2-alpha-L-fucosyltransferase-like [Malania oleifera]
MCETRSRECCVLSVACAENLGQGVWAVWPRAHGHWAVGNELDVGKRAYGVPLGSRTSASTQSRKPQELSRFVLIDDSPTDLSACRRRLSPPPTSRGQLFARVYRLLVMQPGFKTMSPVQILVAVLIAAPLLIVIPMIPRSPIFYGGGGGAGARNLDVGAGNTTSERPGHRRRILGFDNSAMLWLSIGEIVFFQLVLLILAHYVFTHHLPCFCSLLLSPNSTGLKNDTSQPATELKDKFLGGLLASGFDEESCLSRYQSFLYRKASPHIPSPYLQSKLRSYEDLHKRCGPNTLSYNKTVRLLKSRRSNKSRPPDCNYVVWISFSGLGNRMLTLTSAFLYALLTDRVLLVDGAEMSDLFCEPFPESSWLLPSDSPVRKQLKNFDPKSPQCFGKMVEENATTASPAFLYVNLVHDYNEHDKLFFCDEDQALPKRVPWLIIRSDNYFAPAMFLMPSFDQELGKLFPEKEAVFHHLARYLFQPSNQVWGLITRYYQTYLARADEKLGIQVRTFAVGKGPFKKVIDQILECTLKRKLLPPVNPKKPQSPTAASPNPKLKAVLMTSLVSGYSEAVRNMYLEQPTATGEMIGVFQPSHEEYQQNGNLAHERKAWAEIYLLGLTDVLVTSTWSTFGYVAQGLGGLRPWIMVKPKNRTEPPCQRVVSMEPCFHSPPLWDCKAKRGADTAALSPHLRHCEDRTWGVKLVDPHPES